MPRTIEAATGRRRRPPEDAVAPHTAVHQRQEFTMATPPKGPASYFPSIEKKYGHPIAHWKDLIRASPLTRHMELVAWLKTEHGVGHGHANALVAHTLAEDSAE